MSSKLSGLFACGGARTYQDARMQLNHQSLKRTTREVRPLLIPEAFKLFD